MLSIMSCFCSHEMVLGNSLAVGTAVAPLSEDQTFLAVHDVGQPIGTAVKRICVIWVDIIPIYPSTTVTSSRVGGPVTALAALSEDQIIWAVLDVGQAIGTVVKRM